MNQNDAFFDWPVVDDAPMPGARSLVSLELAVVGVRRLACDRKVSAGPDTPNFDANHHPFRQPSRRRQAELHPRRTIRGPAMPRGQGRQVVQGGVAVIQECYHGPGRNSNGSKEGKNDTDKRQIRFDGIPELSQPIFLLCLNSLQGECGASGGSGVPHTQAILAAPMSRV